MSKKILKMIATAMLVALILFIVFALNHPEKSFPWHNGRTYGGLVVYVSVMTVLFVASLGKGEHISN